MSRSQPNQVVVDDEGIPRIAKQIDRKEAMDRAELFVAKNLKKYLKKLHELAVGVAATKVVKGEPQVYLTLPDRAALEYLVDRGLGKIPQRHEIGGPDGGAIEVMPWAPAGLIEGKVTEVPNEDKSKDARTLPSAETRLLPEQTEDEDGTEEAKADKEV